MATRAASSNKGEFDMSKTIHKYVYLAAILVALGMVFVRSSLHAEVILSEIMYDPQNGQRLPFTGGTAADVASAGPNALLLDTIQVP